MKNKRLVLLVDANLSRSQRAVQLAHAAIQWKEDHPGHEWKNENIILKQAKNFSDYICLADSVWRDSYYGDRIVSMAALGIDDTLRHVPLFK